MASLTLERDAHPAPESAPSGAGDLIDFRALMADLEKLAVEHTGGERDLRTVIARRRKAALIVGRAKAEHMLL
jgi:hypothetical protein